MRRRTVHFLFGAVTLAFAAAATYEGFRLAEARQVNATILGQQDASAGSSLPEARFLHAQALAKGGDYEGALREYKSLSRDANARESVATAALYNAANLQLREALKEGRHAAVRALPLIELAKQDYRAALRRDPDNWDARYNLERALWIAPEPEETPLLQFQRETEERVMSTLQSTRADLP